MNDRLRVAIVGKAQGIKGEVRVHPVSNDVSRLLELHNVILKSKKNERNQNKCGYNRKSEKYN